MARNPLMALGYLFLGAGMVREAFRRDEADGRVSGLSGGGLGRYVNPDVGTPLPGEDARAQRALARASASLDEEGFTKGTISTVRDIDERVALIRRNVVEGSKSPRVRSAAVAVLSRKCEWRNGVRWCTTPKAFRDEVVTLYQAVQNAAHPLAQRYVRDHILMDQFPSAEKLVVGVRGDDCDGGTIKLGALYLSVGYPVNLVVIQTTASDSWDHIYLEVGIPPGNPTEWIALDWSVVQVQRDKSLKFMEAGWEAPAAMVRRKKKYSVIPGR